MMPRGTDRVTTGAGTLVAMSCVGPPQAAGLLVLWDVDHTLIETRGVGFAIYQRAFPAATGRRLERLARITGRTELEIMRETLRLNGIDPTEDAMGALTAALKDGYEDAREELATTGRPLPGALAVLQQLAANPLVHQGVLTGNLRSVTRIKLEVFGLANYLDLDASAYGDDDADRAKLVPIAQTRASRRTGTTFDNAHTVLLGDTPHDVEAAAATGVRVIGVATGKSTAGDLEAAGAPTVFPDLTNSGRTVDSILDTHDRS